MFLRVVVLACACDGLMFVIVYICACCVCLLSCFELRVSFVSVFFGFEPPPLFFVCLYEGVVLCLCLLCFCFVCVAILRVFGLLLFCLSYLFVFFVVLCVVGVYRLF